MGESVTYGAGHNADKEMGAFSRLDLLRHSMRTVVHSLRPCDTLSLVGFQGEAFRLMSKTSMTATGKRTALAALESMRDGGSGTNITDAIKLTLADLRSTAAAGLQSGRTVVGALLTDGEPNIRRGEELAAIRQVGLTNASMHFMGYGYSMDSALLYDLARLGGGLANFIPDYTMVGTTFVNWIANSLATAVNRIDLQIQGTGFESIAAYNSREMDQSSMQVVPRIGGLCLGPLRWGQRRTATILLRSKAITSAELALKLYADDQDPVPYRVKLANDEIINVRAGGSICLGEMDLAGAPAADLLLGNVLRTLEGATLASGDRHSTYEEVLRLQAFARQMAHGTDGELTSDQVAANALARDLHEPDPNHGQIGKALERDDWWARWGGHYARAFSRAHQLQVCSNFKDESLQAYSEPLSRELKSEVEAIYAGLNVPTPSRSRYRGNAAQFQQSSYTASGPCFDGAGRVQLASGHIKRVDQLRKGDKIRNSRGQVDTIRCMVETKVQAGVAWVVRRGDMLITPYHPIFAHCPNATNPAAPNKAAPGKQWVFPADVAVPEKVNIDHVYNTVLSGHHGVMTISGQDVITLGHGIVDDPVLRHPFFGTSAVIDHLATHPGWKEGYVRIERYAPAFDGAGVMSGFWPPNDTCISEAQLAGAQPKDECRLPPLQANKLGTDDVHVIEYVRRIYNSDTFRNNPQLYMEQWRKTRGYTEEFRIPEDAARAILARIVQSL
jgi:hypothetical protein